MIFKFRWKPDEQTQNQLYQIRHKLATLEEQLMTLNETLAALAAKVSDQGTVIEAAIALLGSLSAQLAAAKVDPAVAQAILDQVNLQSAALQGAVTTNTPAAP